METTNLNIRTEKAVKMAAERIFNELGLTLSAAINIFVKQSIRENGIPFELKLDIPNAETKAAIEEWYIIGNDDNRKRCKTIDELKVALDL